MTHFPKRAAYCRHEVDTLSPRELRLAAIVNSSPRRLTVAQCVARTVLVVACIVAWFLLLPLAMGGAA